MSTRTGRNNRHPRLVARVLLAALALVLAGCASGPETSGTGARGKRSYSFWPPAPDEPRIQFLTSYRFSRDVEAPRGGFEELVFGTEDEVLPIGKPYGVAMWKGRIYVCDITNPGLVILDIASGETRVMGVRGVEPLRQPVDIAIAPDGMKYVADRRRERVYVFNAADEYVTTFGRDELTPVGVAVHEEWLYVADFESNSIVVLDRRDGSRIGSIGGTDSGDAQFVRPLGVEVDRDGIVHTTDAIRGRVQTFAPDGSLVRAMGQIGDTAGNFVRPKHLAVDGEGVLYVVDAAFQNVQMFDADGEVLMYFGSAGGHDGAMSLPAGITVHEDDLGLFEKYVHPAFEARRLVVVTNQFGLNKVAVYAMGNLKTGRTMADIAPEAMPIATGMGDPGAGAVPLDDAPADGSGPGDAGGPN